MLPLGGLANEKWSVEPPMKKLPLPKSIRTMSFFDAVDDEAACGRNPAAVCLADAPARARAAMPGVGVHGGAAQSSLGESVIGVSMRRVVHEPVR